MWENVIAIARRTTRAKYEADTEKKLGDISADFWERR